MNTNKKKATPSLLTALLALLLIAFGVPASAQSNTTWTAVPLPYTILQSTNAVLMTNLTAGWSVITTNPPQISTVYSNATVGLVTTTNSYIQTNTKYADFQSFGQHKVPLGWDFSCSAGASNYIAYIGKSIDGSSYNTNITALLNPTLTIITNAANGVTKVIGGGEVDMSGWLYGRVLFFKWDTVNAGDFLTNNSGYIRKSEKKNQ